MPQDRSLNVRVQDVVEEFLKERAKDLADMPDRKYNEVLVPVGESKDGKRKTGGYILLGRIGEQFGGIDLGALEVAGKAGTVHLSMSLTWRPLKEGADAKAPVRKTVF